MGDKDEYKVDAVFDSVRPVRGVERAKWRKMDVTSVGVEELRRYLPRDFVDLYLELVYAGIDIGRSGTVDRHEVDIKIIKGKKSLGSTKSETVDSTNLHLRSNSAGSSKPIVLEENALAFRSVIDRRIRKISREIKAFLDKKENGLKKINRRCESCHKFGDGDWTWCPFCRGRMMELHA